MIDKSLKYIDSKLSLWTLLSFLIAGYGVIGFYTIQVRLSIPFSLPAIQVILGVGIFIALYLFLVALFSNRPNRTESTFAIIIVLNFISYDFEWLAIASIAFFWFYSTVYKSGRKRQNDEGNNASDDSDQDEKLTEEGTEEVKVVESSDFVPRRFIIVAGEFYPYLIISLIALFFNIYWLILFQFTYALLDEVRYVLITKSYMLYQLFLFFILVPVFIAYYCIAPSSKSLVGLSYHYVEITTSYSEDKVKGLLVYKNDNFSYLKNSFQSDTTLAINNSEIVEMINLKPKRIMLKNGFYYYIKDWLSNDVEPKDQTSTVIPNDTSITRVLNDSVPESINSDSIFQGSVALDSLVEGRVK